ncbi:hypothetical protein [Oharaeibacter diazotrophicus]|uniref:Uncharacterized protein n=1 Tax=Oharaeibacter diazotrophicus TaxID=1920512 RepID=A0A4R6RNU7_9HYPH|nr:hypothetical protein [Oharaeibacter diazotrophicus]TDP87747.1 hypothetical protein EDD54_1646 [Oharaeibacter diazotrophicus]BBE74670.1 hypothetical protein OHA_1_04305 [Pleomorphomonas sp. SM30]GLS77049.1 hypothetical protein GCM10007904_23860 [Oharaeibacter diazotrophicus]
MIGKMLKRAVAEALGGRRHGYGGKSWKKGGYRDRRYDDHRYGDHRYGDPFGGYGHGRGGYDHGPRRSRGVKGALIDALIGFLARRR